MREWDECRLQHALGLMSRRDVIGRMLALGASAAMADTLLLGVEALAAETPRKGGTLRLGLGGGSTTDSFSPLSWNDSVMIDMGFAVFNGLIENGPDNRPIPELAESYESKDGAKTWIFTLRKGVHFHNGKEFDADDAVYSLNLHRGDSKSGAAGPMKIVSDVTKRSASQIEVTLASGNADFPTVLTDYHIMMVPNGYSEWGKPVGTGAFKVDAFDPGVRIALKNAGPYWKPDRGLLDAIEVNVINDTSARMNALISGQVDAINRADPKTVSRIQKSPTLEIVRAPGGWYPVMAMMVDTAPYDNPDLRKALQYAVDREQMIKTLFSGYGTLGNDNPIPHSDPYFNAQLAQRKYDPDKAKFHFRKAGLSDPKIVVQSSDAAFNGAVDMATLLQASAGKADIAVEVKKEPADGYFDNIWLKGAFVASYWGGRPAATQMLDVAYQSAAPWNESHWKVPAFDTTLAAAQAETDEAKRKTLLWDCQAMLTEQGGTLIPCFRDWLDAHAKKVGGHTPHSGFDMCNGRIAEKAFLKA